MMKNPAECPDDPVEGVRVGLGLGVTMTAISSPRTGNRVIDSAEVPWRRYAYSDSISSAYLATMARRRTLRVGVTSSSS